MKMFRVTTNYANIFPWKNGKVVFWLFYVGWKVKSYSFWVIIYEFSQTLINVPIFNNKTN